MSLVTLRREVFVGEVFCLETTVIGGMEIWRCKTIYRIYYSALILKLGRLGGVGILFWWQRGAILALNIAIETDLRE